MRMCMLTLGKIKKQSLYFDMTVEVDTYDITHKKSDEGI